MIPPRLETAAETTPWLVGGVVSQKTRRITDRHSHGRGQILGVVSGVVGIRTDTGFWLVGPGQVLWLPPGLAHSARTHGAIAGWSLYVAAARAAKLPATPFLIQATRLLVAQAERLAAVSNGNLWNDRNALLAETFWNELMAPPRVTASVPLPADPRLRRVAAEMIENPADQRPLPAWAAQAGMSTRSFVRYFVAETGQPFSVWRQRIRVLSAQERLARDEPVTGVALAVGYDSLGAFSAIFRRMTGLSPSDYAAACRVKT